METYFYGFNNILNILEKYPSKVKKIYINKKSKSNKEITELIKNIEIPINWVEEQELVKLVGEKANHQNIVIKTSDFEYTEFKNIVKNNNEIQTVLILDQIQDPQNLGSILRNSSLFNVDAIIILDHRQAMVNNTVAKVAAGTIFDTPIIKVSNLANAILELKKNGFWVYATHLSQKSKKINQINFANKRAIIIGSEGNGISQKLIGISDELFIIPTSNTIDSLNVSVATGIILFYLNL